MSVAIGFHPADASSEPAFARFDHPIDVLEDCALNSEEKRAILSAWASDAWAVPSAPTLRQPPQLTQPVTVEAILDALNRLDEPPDPRPGGAAMRLPRSERVRWPVRRRLGHLTRRYLERHVFKPPDEIAAAARGT